MRQKIGKEGFLSDLSPKSSGLSGSHNSVTTLTLPTNFRSADYDLEATQRLVDALLATGKVRKILYNDSKIKGVSPQDDGGVHDNHLHVIVDEGG